MAEFGVLYGLQMLVKFKYKNCQLNISRKAIPYTNPKEHEQVLEGMKIHSVFQQLTTYRNISIPGQGCSLSFYSNLGAMRNQFLTDFNTVGGNCQSPASSIYELLMLAFWGIFFSTFAFVCVFN